MSDTCGDFEIIGRLGEGAYGVVEKVRHRISGEIAAAKIALKSKHTKATENEIAILEKLHHPNVLRLLSKHETEKEFWLILEFCAHGSLYDFLKKVNFNLDDTIHSVIAYDMLNALQYLHSAGIIHRDIKARNILLDVDGVCKISDFGISKDSVHGNTFIGSPLWMAPEQVSTQNYTAQVDVWGFGITMLEIAEGKVPHSDKNPYAAMVAITQSEAPFFYAPDRFPKPFQDFIRRCLVKDPVRRATIDELLQHEFITTQIANHELLRVRLITLFKRISCRESVTSVRSSVNPRESGIGSRRISDPTLESVEMNLPSRESSNRESPNPRLSRNSRGRQHFFADLNTLNEEPEETMSPELRMRRRSLEHSDNEASILPFEVVKRSTMGASTTRTRPFTRDGTPGGGRTRHLSDDLTLTVSIANGGGLTGLTGVTDWGLGGGKKRTNEDHKESSVAASRYHHTDEPEPPLEDAAAPPPPPATQSFDTPFDVGKLERELFEELETIVLRYSYRFEG